MVNKSKKMEVKEMILKINLKKRIKKDSKESFKINIKYDDLCIRVKIL